MRKLYGPEKLLSELGIVSPEDIDVEAIAQYCGATILPQKISGSAARIIGLGKRAIIVVDSKSPRARQRFSAAHELGHWMLDRGKLASFVCSETNLINDWSGDNPERRANRYAAELLLPRFIFEPLAKNKEITFQTVRDLCAQFETSLTATAIRLVELGSFPSIVTCHNKEKRWWQIRSNDIPCEIQLRDMPTAYTNAHDLLHHKIIKAAPTEVQASDWITHPRSHYYSIYEDSVRINEDLVLSLLWWKNESQLLDLEEDDFDF